MLKLIVCTILALAFAIFAMCVGVIFRRDGQFRHQHIGENKRMRDDGISCATSQDRKAQKGNKLNININEM